jgi:hypothetical protein
MITDNNDRKSQHRRGGRPSVYSPPLASAICDRLALGQTLKRICDDGDMPERRTVQRWVDDMPEFCRMYARARLHGATALVEDVDERIVACLDAGAVDRDTAKAISLLVRELGAHRRWLAERYDRETFGPQQRIEIDARAELRRLSTEELRYKLLEALSQRPDLIPIALAREPDLEPELRKRGLLDPPRVVVEGQTVPVVRR